MQIHFFASTEYTSTLHAKQLFQCDLLFSIESDLDWKLQYNKNKLIASAINWLSITICDGWSIFIFSIKQNTPKALGIDIDSSERYWRFFFKHF